MIRRFFLFASLCLLPNFCGYAQCNIEIIEPDADTVHICAGDPVFLGSEGDCDDYFLNEDFNDGDVGAGWSRTTLARFDNPCGPAYDGQTYFWIGTSTLAQRYLETEFFNIPKNAGAQIRFWMKYAPSTQNASDAPCEGPELTNEGVGFQYSFNGINWVEIRYWTPDPFNNDPTLVNWTQWTIDLPDNVCVSKVKFRWRQRSVTNTMFDHWGIDDVEILANLPEGKVKWSHGPEVFDPPPVYPDQDTKYIVTLDNGHFSCSDTVYVKVHPRPIKNENDTLWICSGDNVQIGKPVDLGAFDVIWEPAEGLSDTSTDAPIASPTESTMYVRRTFNFGCESYDTVFVNVYPPIDIDYTDNYEICSSTKITLGEGADVSGGEGEIRFEWNPKTYILGNSKSPEVEASPEEDIVYTLTARDEAGCEYTFDVNVDAKPSPKVDFETHFMICPDSVITIGGEAIAGDPPFEYSWSPETGLDSPSSAATVARVTRTTIYTLTIIGANDCQTEVDVLVEIEPIPNAIAGEDRIICFGDSVGIGGVAFCGVEPYEYQWSPVEGLSDPQSAEIWAKPTETTEYILTVVDGLDRTAKDSVIVTVNPELFFDLPETEEICFGYEKEIGAEAIGGTPPYIFAWSPAEGLNRTDSNYVIASPIKNTTYEVRIVDTRGCEIIKEIEIIVNPNPEIDAGEAFSACAGLPEEIGNEAVSGTPPFEYSWSPTAGLSDPNSAVTEAEPTKTTMYFLTVTDSKGCTATDSVLAEINPVPTAVAGEDVSICLGDTIQIGGDAFCGKEPFTYVWEPTTGLSDPGISSPFAYPTETTEYIVTATDDFGRSNSDSVIIEVLPVPKVENFSDATICFGDQIWIGKPGVSESETLVYEWTPEELIIEIRDHEALVGPTENTEFIQKITNADGCSVYDTIAVTVNPRIEVEIDGPTEICYGRPFRLSSTVTGGTPPYEYQWLPASATDDSQSREAEFYKEFSDEYVLIVTDARECQVLDTFRIEYIRTSATVRAPNLEFDPRDRDVSMPIYLDEDSDILKCDPDSVYLKLRFDATLFNPNSATVGALSKTLVGFYWDVEIAAANPGWINGEPLTEIIGDALLGGTDTTTIDIYQVEWAELLLETFIQDGSFRLINLCTEEDIRLLNYDFLNGGIQIVPNPAEFEINVVVRPKLAAGEYEIAVYDALGGEVLKTFGKFDESDELSPVKIETGRLKNGVYRVIFTSQSGSASSEFVIIK